MSVRDKLQAGFYDTQLEWPGRIPHNGTPSQRQAVIRARNAHRDEEYRLREVFKTDSLTEVGLINHKNADKIWDKAWSEGHAEGLQRVLEELEELADLVL